jgi:hypothetical protein
MQKGTIAVYQPKIEEVERQTGHPIPKSYVVRMKWPDDFDLVALVDMDRWWKAALLSQLPEWSKRPEVKWLDPQCPDVGGSIFIDPAGELHVLPLPVGGLEVQ